MVKTWETTPEGATRVINPDALIRKNADVFRWVQEAFGRNRGGARSERLEASEPAEDEQRQRPG